MDAQKLFTGAIANPLAYGILPGHGLQGTPFRNRGDVSWSIVFAGTGVAETASRSDHTHPPALPLWTDPIIKDYSDNTYYKLIAVKDVDPDGNIVVMPRAIQCDPPLGAE